jgi:hypothetical protein
MAHFLRDCTRRRHSQATGLEQGQSAGQTHCCQRESRRTTGAANTREGGNHKTTREGEEPSPSPLFIDTAPQAQPEANTASDWELNT